MRIAFPPYVTPIVLAAVLGLTVWLPRLVARGAEAAGLPPATRRRVFLSTSLVLGAWLLLALLRAPTEVVVDANGRGTVPPAFAVFGTASLVAALGALVLSDAWRRTVAAIRIESLVATQVFRIVGLLFVVLWATGSPPAPFTLPAHFALPAGWGDVAVGLAAPLVALALTRRAPGARALALGWNILGLLDLLAAVGLGTGYLLQVLRPGIPAGPAGAMTVFPLVLIPTFGVPLGVILHLYTFRALARGRPADARGAALLSPRAATAR